MGIKDDNQKVVISVGGSLIVPNGGINTKFLSHLNDFVRNQLAQNHKRQFFLVIGGGYTARHYIEAGRKVIGHELSNDDLDWLGIHGTRLNAHLVRTIFRDIAHPNIIKHYNSTEPIKEPVVVASGWKPGRSTDYCAILLCESYNVKTVINLSNIPQLFDRDPAKFTDAKPIKHIAWTDFRKMFGEKWSPGLNAPFDPIAAKKAQEMKLKVAILSGSDFNNIRRYFDNKEFIGTIVE